MKDGGWCWYEDPRAIIHNGKLVIGAISGVSGDIRVGVYDLDREEPIGVAVLDHDFELDDHNSPVFFVRPDGSLVAVWAEHGKKNQHYFSISSPDDYLKWGERQVFVHDYPVPEGAKWMGVTYTNLYRAGPGGLLHNFFRSGDTYNPSFHTSPDGGRSWTAHTHLITDEVDGRQRPYARYTQVTDTTVGISFTDGHPRVYGNSIYYVNFDGRSFFNADGTKVKDLAAGPLSTTEAEELYVGSKGSKSSTTPGSVPGAAWTCELEADAAGRPYVGYTLYRRSGDIRFRLANWTGEHWVDREIAHAGPGLYAQEDSYSGLLALDPQQPEHVFISTPVDPGTGAPTGGGAHEIYAATVTAADSTATIDWRPLTRGSAHKNIRPIVVSGGGYRVLLWLGGGPWRNFQDYETDVLGYVLDRPPL